MDSQFIFGMITGFLLAVVIAAWLLLSAVDKDEKLKGKQTSWEESEDDEYHN